MTVSILYVNRDSPNDFRGNASQHHTNFEHVTFLNHDYYDLDPDLSETNHMHLFAV